MTTLKEAQELAAARALDLASWNGMSEQERRSFAQAAVRDPSLSPGTWKLLQGALQDEPWAPLVAEVADVSRRRGDLRARLIDMGRKVGALEADADRIKDSYPDRERWQKLATEAAAARADLTRLEQMDPVDLSRALAARGPAELERAVQRATEHIVGPTRKGPTDVE